MTVLTRKHRFLCLALALLFVFSAPATSYAAACSNAQIRAAMDAGSRNRNLRIQQQINTSWQNPSSFSSMYCGVNILNNFDNIAQTLSNGLFSLVRSALQNLMNQACQAAIAPIQNAAAQLCIPFFSLPNLNLNLNINRNYCNGISLLNVNAVYGTGYGGGNYSPIPGTPPWY
jgi:hypothetical protein